MELIRIKRKALGLTVQELADQVGITKQALSRIELGDNTPTPKTLAAICRVLKTTPAILAGKAAQRIGVEDIVFTRYTVFRDGFPRERKFKTSKR
jgi:transcriptional regulator with XRE-family HTH domain